MPAPVDRNFQGRIGSVPASTEEVKALQAKARKHKANILREDRKRKISESGNPYISMGGRR